MIRTLKRWIKAVAAGMGVVMFKRSTGLYLPETEMPLLVQRLCGKNSPVIIDGGAHRGDFVHAIRRVLPNASFICFEPAPELVSELRATFIGDPLVVIVAAALGDVASTAKFNLNKALATNSLLPSADQTTGSLRELITTQATVDVEVTTIDAALDELNQPVVDIIKLDLQGYDFPALIGATQALRTASVVVVEVWFAQVYKGAADYLQVCTLMHERGFGLYTLTSLHYSSTDRLVWGDAVFVPRNSSVWNASITN